MPITALPAAVAAGGWSLSGPGALAWRPFSLAAPDPGWVLLQVAGCGLCHTDLGFCYDAVPTRHALPLVLGHEICGCVVAAGAGSESWIGRTVVVPAVIPCYACPACRAGRPTICRSQFMPGNDGDGGFATHVAVPARGLCAVPDSLPPGIEPAMLSVVADAVTTPYEAICRAGLTADDVAVFVGVGGIGGFGVQIAAAFGAAVVAIDLDDERLALAAQHGASAAFRADDPELKQKVRAFAKQTGRPGVGMKVFETSGTTAGQKTAFSLLDFGGYLGVVGYTPKPVELRLSNLMALDATARGNWGCAPERYPAALALVLTGKVALAPFVELHPLADAPAVFERAHRHELKRRAILVPRRNGEAV